MVMVKFNIHKSDYTTDEDFLSSLECAKTCIQNVLYDSNPMVKLSESVITVGVVDLTEQQCKKQVEGCFFDSFGDIYPEFRRIEVL